VVVQICGLSHHAVGLALARGHMPVLARLLRRGALRLHRIPGGLPTSTPAFQAAAMYGGPVDIPGFEFLDRRAGAYRWFPRPWDAAAVEAAHARHGRGVLRGGCAYGCVFGGEADHAVLTFSRLFRPGASRGRPGFRPWVFRALLLARMGLGMSAVTLVTLARWTAQAARALALGARPVSPRPALVRLLVSGWLRQFFTLGVTADLQAGVPVLWVNFVDYDVQAHELGPAHPRALRALRAVDRSLAAVVRGLRRGPGPDRDLYVLSDHGQVASVPFSAVSGGVPAAEAILALFGTPHPCAPRSSPPEETGKGAPLPLWPFAPAWQRGLEDYGERPAWGRSAVWGAGLCVVPAGPNVNVYLTGAGDRVLAEAIEARYPGALDRLARHPGIGLVLTRDASGPVCYHRGAVWRIPPAPGPSGCPLFDRPDREVVVRALEGLLAMPSSGDVILFGHYTEAGCVNYLDERGSHAGPSEQELYPFLAAPPHVDFDFDAVAGPRDLHALFLRYQRGPGAEDRP
jgi:hypothetical protein